MTEIVLAAAAVIASYKMAMAVAKLAWRIESIFYNRKRNK